MTCFNSWCLPIIHTGSLHLYINQQLVATTSTQEMSGGLEPRILDVMTQLSEYADPEILVILARCCKEMHGLIIPTLEHKMQDKDTVRLMILRLFPGIRDLASDKDLGYYRRMLDVYFSTASSQFGFLPSRKRVVSVVNDAIGVQGLYVAELIRGVAPAMRTAKGRKLVIVAIKDMQDFLWNKYCSNCINHVVQSEICRLEKMIVAVRTDFTVKSAQITSQYDWRLD